MPTALTAASISSVLALFDAGSPTLAGARRLQGNMGRGRVRKRRRDAQTARNHAPARAAAAALWGRGLQRLRLRLRLRRHRRERRPVVRRQRVARVWGRWHPGGLQARERQLSANPRRGPLLGGVRRRGRALAQRREAEGEGRRVSRVAGATQGHHVAVAQRHGQPARHAAVVDPRPVAGVIHEEVAAKGSARDDAVPDAHSRQVEAYRAARVGGAAAHERGAVPRPAQQREVAAGEQSERKRADRRQLRPRRHGGQRSGEGRREPRGGLGRRGCGCGRGCGARPRRRGSARNFWCRRLAAPRPEPGHRCSGAPPTRGCAATVGNSRWEMGSNSPSSAERMRNVTTETAKKRTLNHKDGRGSRELRAGCYVERTDKDGSELACARGLNHGLWNSTR